MDLSHYFIPLVVAYFLSLGVFFVLTWRRFLFKRFGTSFPGMLIIAVVYSLVTVCVFLVSTYVLYNLSVFNISCAKGGGCIEYFAIFVLVFHFLPYIYAFLVISLIGLLTFLFARVTVWRRIYPTQSRRGSTTTWFVLAALLVVVAGGGVYFYKHPSVVLENQSQTISVLMQPGTPEAQTLELKSYIERQDAVRSVQYMSAEQVLARFKEAHSTDSIAIQALNELDTNPLGATLTVQLDPLSQKEAVIDVIRASSVTAAIERIE